MIDKFVSPLSQCPNTIYGFEWPVDAHYACAYRQRLSTDVNGSELTVEFFSCKYKAGARYLELLNESKKKRAELKIQRYEYDMGPKCYVDFDCVKTPLLH